jgi:hypothetical protein
LLNVKLVDASRNQKVKENERYIVYILFDTLYELQSFVNRTGYRKAHVRFMYLSFSSSLSLLISYIYGAPCKARNFNLVYSYIYIYGPMFENAESRLFLLAAQCFNTESMQKVILWHSRV